MTYDRGTLIVCPKNPISSKINAPPAQKAMIPRKLIPGFLLALTGQGVLFAVAYSWRMQSQTPHFASITLLWMILFAGLTGALLTVGDRQFQDQASKSRLISLIVPGLLALFGYIVALFATQGLIRNLGFPLILIFLAGSVSAFVGSFWKGRITSALLSLLVIFAMGYIPTIAYWITERDYPTRITVVKLIPGNAAELKIVIMPGTEIEDHEKAMLSDLHLRGEAQIVQTFELGPKKGSTSHTIIVLTQPPTADVFLHESKSNVVYLLEGPNWTTIPASAQLSWRTIELYPTSSRCIAIGLWRRLGRRSASQGPCW